MKMLGYDAMTLGDLEFTGPREILMQQREWAGFPFLSANVIKKQTGELLVDRYIIKEFDGLQVAIFGLTLEEISVLGDHGYIGDLEFRSVIETAQDLVPKLRAEADLVIGLPHIGCHETAGVGYRNPG
ncbi:predicted protein [Candidatus Vecturithrix granuli]|uniref:Uncharacterized protein n=1 Tax=Vecturithrix granuli TaxID=1499967 RepID=A0A081C197_VECG1|nr:predicted protein [Candidatus Vecturithrix granuli]